MKNKEFHKLLKKNQSNSGFTLTELLVGLIMSVFVIGALGWGLMQLLTTTKTETSRVKTRNETARAFNFIADEVKASQSIEVKTTEIIDFTDTSKVNEVITYLQTNDDPATLDINEAIANSFTPPTGGIPRLALQIPGVDQRVIYSVASPQTSTWQGPLVIYRWGPSLDKNGSYSNPNSPGDWQNEALIDGVSDANQNNVVDCDLDNDGTAEDVTYQGFYACVVDDDGDTILDAAGNPIVENATDTNGDGKIDSNDTADLNGDGEEDAGDGADTDGVSITAQLYFAGKTDDGEDPDDPQDDAVYLLESQVVARARVAPLRKPELNENKLLEIQPFPGNYGRNIGDDDDNPCWTVRNDFGQGTDPTALPDSGNELKNVTTVIHEDNRQPQPINIDTSKPFTIVASAFGGLDDKCLARGNKYQRIWDSDNDEYRDVDSNGSILTKEDNETDEEFQTRLASNRVAADGSEDIHTYEHKIWHTIDFSDPNTFNGTKDTSPDVSRDAASNSPTEGTTGAGDVRIFKSGDIISSSADYQGYDADDTGDRDQKSIEAFLKDKGYVDANGKVIKLESNQRIIAFEIGQDVATLNGNPNPGFDLQDNVFIMTSDAFK